MSRVRSRLRTICEDRGISFKSLHLKTGVRESTIGDYANDMTDRINLRHYELFCDVLECQFKDLFEFYPE